MGAKVSRRVKSIHADYEKPVAAHDADSRLANSAVNQFKRLNSELHEAAEPDAI